MYWDWESVSIVFSLLMGLTIVILSVGFGVIHSRPPASPQEHHWYELEVFLAEVARKAAMAERAEKRLSMVREAAQMILNNLEASELKKLNMISIMKEPRNSLSTKEIK